MQSLQFLLITALSLPYVKSAVSSGSELGVKLNGRTILFHRRFRLFGIPVNYDHKGIIFYPSICKCPHATDSSNRPLDSDSPYVIHLWGSGSDLSKRGSLVRIDPLDEVALGDPVTVEEDRVGALTCDTAMSRAFSELGLGHRGLKYNIAVNNCGSFVAWAKYGRSERDAQFWSRSKQIASKFHPSYGPKVVGAVSTLVRYYFWNLESKVDH